MLLKLHHVPLDKLFFSADSHYGHKLMLQRRGFETVEDMDAELIKRWNAVVGPEDHIFFLGDLSYHGPDKTLEILETLNGIKYLTEGNHDWQLMKPKIKQHFQVIADRIDLEVQDDLSIMNTKKPMEKKYQTIILDHYPKLSWQKSFHGSWHLFGHVHGRNAGVGKSLDVGVDVHDLQPISYQAVREHMLLKNLHEKNEI